MDWHRSQSAIFEINIVNRKLLIAIDEINHAVADTRNRWNVQLHRAKTRSDRPRTCIYTVRIRGSRIADAQGKRFDSWGSVAFISDACDLGVSVDDDVHAARPVQHDFS